MQVNTGSTLQEPNTGNSRRKNIFKPVIWGGAASLLLLPLIAMQFTTEVNWTGSDFAVMGAMLLGVCCLYEFGVWLSDDTAYRAGFGVATGASFLMVWINLAVGIIGTEQNPANLMFAGVLVIGLTGSFVARFQAKAMALALLVTAVAQALVGIIVLLVPMPGAGFEAPVLCLAFCAMWLTSARLFLIAASAQNDNSPSGNTVRKLQVHKSLSELLMVNGAIFLVVIIYVENEPGLIPLLVLISGVAWNVLACFKIRNHRKP